MDQDEPTEDQLREAADRINRGKTLNVVAALVMILMLAFVFIVGNSSDEPSFALVMLSLISSIAFALFAQRHGMLVGNVRTARNATGEGSHNFALPAANLDPPSILPSHIKDADEELLDELEMVTGG